MFAIKCRGAGVVIGRCLFILSVLWPGLALADPQWVLGQAAQRRMADRPGRALEEAAELIYGYGARGRLGPEGIGRYVDLSRARIRAREVARLLKADLDGDMQVSDGELRALQAVSTPGARGRLQIAFRAADTDGDDLVNAGELHDHAGRIAMDELDQKDAADLFGLLSFDSDGDGTVTLDEVAEGIDRIAPRL